MPCYSPLKGYKDPESGRLVFRNPGNRETMEVACGQCLGCRLDRSRMWAARIVHEAQSHDSNLFITLTYRPKVDATKEQLENKYHIPDDWSLDKQHFQKFIKRLRKSRTGQKIKYYHAGEYGNICKHSIDLDLAKCPKCNVGRPHYHAILFGVSFNDLKPYSKTGSTIRYTSQELENIWKHGFVDVGQVEYQSAAYVARYIMKKVTGEPAKDHYKSVTEEGEIIDIQPEYSTMSNGIGKDWIQKYQSDVFPSDEMPVSGHGVIKKVPKYYENQLEKTDPVMLEEIKERRQKFRRENASEYTSERLMSKYKVKNASIQTLKRGNQ
jgi:hypothetical protein